jgi:hypothetical protein
LEDKRIYLLDAISLSLKTLSAIARSQSSRPETIHEIRKAEGIWSPIFRPLDPTIAAINTFLLLPPVFESGILLIRGVNARRITYH